MSQGALAPLLAAIDAVTSWLAHSGVPAAVVGGVAASIHGQPRVTKDVDVVAMVDIDDCERLLGAAAKHQIEPRIPDAIEFARSTRVLLLRHVGSGVELDVSLGALPFERDLVDRGLPIEVGGIRFPLARPEDIVIMKALAMRPRDIADIAAIVEANPDLDLDRVRAKVEEFAAVLEEADLVAELDRIVSSVRGR